MKHPVLENGGIDKAQLGEPRFVCRTSRKTLFWGFILASLPAILGLAALWWMLQMLLEDWSKDICGSLVVLAIGGVCLWGSGVLWRKASRLRHVEVVVHAGALFYRDGSSSFLCRWDEIEEVRWRVANHYEETSLTVGGVVRVPGTTTRSHSHTSHQVTVRRKDGAQMVFTNELQNVEKLARAIQGETSRSFASE
jgi:hypothetical protein